MATDQARAELGESDAPEEDELAEAFDRIVSEGAQRLHRTWREVLTTGLAGGLEVGVGVVALLAVYAETGSHLLAGLAFSIGFIALLLARSELFTEGFLVPVTAVVSGRASAGQLAKLWAGTLVANLIGGWLVMWLVVHALPELGTTAVESSLEFVDAPLDLRAACLAFLAGSVITLMTRMQHGADSRGREDRRRRGGRLRPGRPGAVPLDPGLADHLRRHPRRRAARLRRLGVLVLVHHAAQHGRRPRVVTLLRLVRSKDLIERERQAAGADG